MQRYNRPDAQGVFHYLTLNVRDRKRAFIARSSALVAMRKLRFECDRHPAKLIAYVVMPDHLHAIVWLEDGELSRFLRRLKPGITLALSDVWTAQGKEKALRWLQKKERRELWQDGKHSLHLWSDEFVRQKIDYIHENPVRAGLTESPFDYFASSIGAFFPLMGGTPPVKVDEWRWE